MACTDCLPGTSTVIFGEDGVSVNGSGTPSDPYVISQTETLDGDLTFSKPINDNPNIDLSSEAIPFLGRITLGGARTLTLPTWPANRAGSITLVIRQDGVGGRTLDFAGAGVLSQAPIALSTDPNAIDLVVILWTGDEWIGLLSATDVS